MFPLWASACMLHLLLQLLNTDISMQLFGQSILEYHGVPMSGTQPPPDQHSCGLHG